MDKPVYRVRTVQSLVKNLEKDKIKLTHKLQRKEGQWSTQKKSLLIDSLLRGMPVNPVYIIKEDDTLSVIDGVQRLSTLRDYVADKFVLSKGLKSVIINGEEKEIAGKKFSKLDEDVQDAIKDSELQVCEMSNCTEEDVREAFYRQNNGKPLNAKQLRSTDISDTLNEYLCDLLEHPLMDKLCTKTQRKNSSDRDVIIQTLMLIETNQEHEYLSFKSKDINNFLLWYCANINVEDIEILKQAMTKIDEHYETLVLPISTSPMVLYSAYRIIKSKKSFTRFLEILGEFIDNYNDNEEYKKYLQSATSSKENVTGRYEYFKELIKQVA